MDPVTTIGLVSGVLTFLTFGTAVVKGAVGIHQSSNGVLEGIKSSEDAARELKRLATRLRPPHSSNLNGQDDLCVLADECCSQVEKLVALLEDLKPDDHKSKRRSLWASLKNKLHEKERNDLEGKLKGFRDRLQLQLVAVMRTSLEELVTLVKANAVNTEDLQQSICQLKQGVEIAGLSDSAKSQIRSLLTDLLTAPDKFMTGIAQHRIIDALAFPDMHGRHDSIERAHAQTFRWLMYYDATDDEAIMKKLWWLDREEALVEAKKAPRFKAHKRFTNWLKSGNGIFHISGKLGSGKSTLMKYLGDEAKKSKYLQTWACGRKLVFAQFYFWRHGAEPLQRSLDGLRRTLLCEVLRQYPELIPTVLPSQWKGSKALSLQASPLLWHVPPSPSNILPPLPHISQDEVEDAFALLVNSIGSERYRELCFCFFIDGLDEFESRGRNDYTAMAKLLNEWMTNGSSANGIKICVSSRDYNAFQDAFLEERRLHLHDLTRIDIEVVVRHDLHQISGSPGFDSLVHDILQAAQGIFQWVTAVVRYAREQISSGIDNAEELRADVKNLPTETFALYKEVLKRLPDATTRRRAYRTLAMVLEANRLGLRLSVDAYSFFRNYEADRSFSMRDSVPGAATSDSEQRGIKLLRGCSGGLFEPFAVHGRAQDCERPKFQSIRFTHRSVADFLASNGIQEEKIKHLAEFSSLEAVSYILLADLRMFYAHLTRRRSGRLNIHFLIATASFSSRLLRSRYDAGLDKEPYSFLEALDTIFSDMDALSANSMARLSFNVWEAEFTESDRVITRCCACRSFGNTPGDTLTRIILLRPIYSRIFMGPPEYPLWKIQKDSSVSDSVEKMALLTYMLFSRRRMKACQDERAHFAILDVLHEKQAFTHTTHLAPKATFNGVYPNGMTPNLTIWQHFLQFEWIYQHGDMSSRRPKSCDPLPAEELDARFAKILLWFLERGADPTFAVEPRAFEAPSPNNPRERLSVDFLFATQTGGRIATVVRVNDTFDLSYRVGFGQRRNLPVTKRASLRDWILDLKVDEQSKNEILQLLPETTPLTMIHENADDVQWHSLKELSDVPRLNPIWRTALALIPLIGPLILYYLGWATFEVVLLITLGCWF
ncbi:hypothetical protein QBC40DRAFT_280073 [Triangularia verruculosa]|uniref:Nephrocystin 3-like N-terminal domain-containing protein n=1 Tax=Triangularia verruculosa TaxID=2587418 RepID=A0AAN6XGT5_9PEZI|nr:hypothetical protein QBC40DRAFT_280073 [Triangularia verruculosa]